MHELNRIGRFTNQLILKCIVLNPDRMGDLVKIYTTHYFCWPILLLGFIFLKHNFYLLFRTIARSFHAFLPLLQFYLKCLLILVMRLKEDRLFVRIAIF